MRFPTDPPSQKKLHISGRDTRAACNEGGVRITPELLIVWMNELEKREDYVEGQVHLEISVEALSGIFKNVTLEYGTWKELWASEEAK